jgi:hypothetical protein
VLEIGRRRRGISLLTTVAVAAAILAVTGSQSFAASRAQMQAAVPPIPPKLDGEDRATYLDGKAAAAKAKVQLNIPTTLFRVYANEVQVHLPLPGGNEILNSHSRAWVVSPPGSAQPFGIFAPIRTTVLAFGSIPVTATVHLSQIVVKGQPEAFTVFASGTQNPPKITLPTVVNGRLQLRLSDVAVDQVPLDVGPSCQLSTPMKLQVVGISPVYNLFFGGPLSGAATIPSFAGCHNGSEDLDPLITGMISGGGNPVSLRQGVLGKWIEPNGPCDSMCTPPLSSAAPQP